MANLSSAPELGHGVLQGLCDKIQWLVVVVRIGRDGRLPRVEGVVGRDGGEGVLELSIGGQEARAQRSDGSVPG